MIEFDNVSKTYPNGTHALYNVSLNIDKGEFVFIVGASGAGKSTFLKLIMHEETPSEGRIVINDSDITRLRRRDVPYLRRHMGIVFQDFRLIEKMNVFDNVAFAMRAVGERSATIKKRVPYVLDLVGLKDKMKDKPSELSGGEQQRVSLARALVNNPEIIVADEPTGNVDPELSHEILELLNEINAMGTTVLVVTHEHELVREFHRRVITIDKGRVVSDTAADMNAQTYSREPASADYYAQPGQAQEEALPAEEFPTTAYAPETAMFDAEPDSVSVPDREDLVDLNAFAQEVLAQEEADETDDYTTDQYKGAHFVEEEGDSPQYPDNVLRIPE